jgi:hypothetical protein
MLNIIFEFVGGPHDGKSVSGFLGEADDAERYYLFTSHGTVGYLFKVASDYAVETLARGGLKAGRRHNFQKHFYVVTDRIEDEGEVYVRAEYVPEAVKTRREA